MSAVGGPQRSLISGGILSRDARLDLTSVLGELSEVRSGPVARDSLIALAGLRDHLNIDLEGSPWNFAGSLVSEAEQVGLIVDQEGIHYALERLLNHLLSLDHLPPRHKPFIANLVDQFQRTRLDSQPDTIQLSSNADETIFRDSPLGQQTVPAGSELPRSAPSTLNASHITDRLWFRYALWLIVPFLSWLAAVTQLFELSPCYYYPFAAIIAFFGGLSMLIHSLFRQNRHRYSNRERGLTLIIAVLATGFFAILSTSRCAPLPPVVPTLSNFVYVVLVQQSEPPNEGINGAYVELLVSPPVADYADISGRASLTVDETHLGRIRSLRVTALGFIPVTLEVELEHSEEPKIIRLEKDQTVSVGPTTPNEAPGSNGAEPAEVTQPPYPQPPAATLSTSSDQEDLWEQEPNSPYWEADGPIVSNHSNYGYLNDEKDYWTLYLPSSGLIKLDLTNTSAPSQLQLFYDVPSEATRIAYASAPPYHIEHKGEPGLYYIMVGTTSGFNNSYPYMLRAQFPIENYVTPTSNCRSTEYLEQWVGYNFEEDTENWWSAETDHKLATVETSRDEACRGSQSLKLTTELKPNAGLVYLHTSPTVYFDNGIPQGMDKPGPYDLTGKRVLCYVYLPNELATDDSVQIYVNLFVKDEAFRNQYSSRLDVTENTVNSWQELSLIVGDEGHIDAGFDTQNVNALGVVINLESWASLHFIGSIYIDECQIEYP